MDGGELLGGYLRAWEVIIAVEAKRCWGRREGFVFGLGRQGGERGMWGAAVGRWEGGGEMGRRHREVDGAADPGRKLSSIYAPCHWNRRGDRTSSLLATAAAAICSNRTSIRVFGF
jgi:hypothetical protein